MPKALFAEHATFGFASVFFLPSLHCTVVLTVDDKVR